MTMPHLPPIVSCTPGDKELTAAAAAAKGQKKKYIGWWQGIEPMFDNDLMLNLKCDPYTKKPCEEGLWIQCTLCQMSEGHLMGISPYIHHLTNIIITNM
jgi:hypothetical protein